MKTSTLDRMVLVLIVSATSACGAGSSSSGGSQLVAACTNNTNAPPEACECLAKGAEANLSRPALAWLTAALSGDTALAVKLKDDVPIADLLEASTLMMNFAERCAIPETALSQIQ
ncbi:MAG: hypothetical protein AAGG11_10020 [Pseudomonadota bacterium]